MSFSFCPLHLSDVRIMGAWHYEPPYDYYDLGYAYIFRAALLRWLDAFFGNEFYYGVWSEAGELVGLFTFTLQGTVITLGLAMRPDLTGKGLGLEFVRAGMAFAKQRFFPNFFRLEVRTFNQRAIKVYERAGFKPGKTFWRLTRRGMQEYLVMARVAYIQNERHHAALLCRPAVFRRGTPI